MVGNGTKMNPFDENPTPWKADFDETEGIWWIDDANGKSILYASVLDTSKETINKVVRIMNAYGKD